MVDRGGNRPWYHGALGRMDSENMLVSCNQDGAFLIRASETRKDAYVLSLIHMKRIHHYRILPNENGSLSVQAQTGVQKKQFTSLDDLVQFYNQPKRGLVCALTTPIGQYQKGVGENADDSDYDDPDDDDDDDDEIEVEEKVDVDKDKNTLTKYLQASIVHVDLNRADPVFQQRLRQYLDNEVVVDVNSMASPKPQLTHLKQLVLPDIENVHRNIDKLMQQVDTLQNFLDLVYAGRQAASTKPRSTTDDNGFDSLSHKLEECSGALKKLETSAFSTYKHLSTTLTGAANSSLVQQPFSAPGMEDVSFDVKVEAIHGKKTLCLNVSLKTGHLTVTRQGETTGTTYQPSQVIQLIKSRSREQKLGLLLEGQSRRDYIFASMQAREHFCQLIQVIRNKMQGAQRDPDSISIFVGSWNMGDAGPPADINSWMKCEGLGRSLDRTIAAAHDIYAIGTQETGMNEKDWVTRLKSTLKSLVNVDYEKVEAKTLWGIRLVILVKPEHAMKITHLQTSQVRTGIGNALGNKGAVGLSFYFGNLSLCFISGHLTSGTEKCHRRNQNYHDILKGMCTLKHRHLNQFDLVHQFHHIFYFGDLNYRVEMNSEEIVALAKSGDYHTIYCSDQLRREKERKKVFVGFEEAPIVFPPTYRFKKGERSMSSYVWIKHKRSGDRVNEPSYCDRVLWRSYPGTRIINTSYGCTNNITTSDHSPVFSTFQIGGVKQFTSAHAPSTHIDPNAFIIISQCNAKILTNSKTYFYIEIHSRCFEGVVKTKTNISFRDTCLDSVTPQWSTRPGAEPICKIKPVVTSHEYMLQQHILLLVKSTDSDEPCAECCIALGRVINPVPQVVERELIHQGQSVGQIECHIHVTMSQYVNEKSAENDIYGNIEFICSEMDSTADSRSRTRAGSSSTQDFPSRPPVPIPGSAPINMSSRPPLPPPDRDQGNWHLQRSGSASGILPSRPPVMPPSSLPTISSHPVLLHNTSVANGSQYSTPTSHSSATLPASAPPVAPRRREPPPNTTTPVSSRPPLSGPPLPYRPGGVSPEPNSVPPVPSRRNPGPKPPVAERPAFVHSCSQPLPAVPNAAPTYDTLERVPTSASNRPQPPVPSRRRGGGGGDSPQLPQRRVPQTTRTTNSLEELLITNGLSQYSNMLMENGYDDINFVGDISLQDLKECGVINQQDREKLYKLFHS